MAMRDGFPMLGYGVGLRRPHYAEVIENRPPLDWFEIISENFMVAGGWPREVLERVGERYPLVMHGVAMSLGSTDPLDRSYLGELAALARRVAPAWVSDHLCWSGVGGHSLHDLLPLPYTEEAVRHVARRIREVQEMLARPLVIENISSYLTFGHSALTEWEFLSAVASEADCAILLDLNNLFVNACNHGFDAGRYLDALDPARVVQFHLAGYSDHGAYLLDSHDHPIADAVWRLYDRAVARFGPVSTLIEWDEQIPSLAALAALADEARRRAALVVGPPGSAALAG